jgi:hypothetical protein
MNCALYPERQSPSLPLFISDSLSSVSSCGTCEPFGYSWQFRGARRADVRPSRVLVVVTERILEVLALFQRNPARDVRLSVSG